MSRIQPYLARLYRYAYSLTRDEEAAKDLVQQCAVKALGARTEPKDEPAYRAWLFVILRNALIDETRRRKASEALLETAPTDETEMEFWDGDERFINVLSVKQALTRLAPRDRDVIALVDLAGLSYAETAEVLGVPRGTVMSRISRARRRLIALMEQSNVTQLAVRRRRGK